MYNPVLFSDTVDVEPSRVEPLSDSADIFYFELENMDESNNTLLFYTNHQTVFAYADGKLIYSIESAESVFGRTPGAIWNMVVVPAGTEEVSIEISQIYPQLAKQQVEFRRGNAVNMFRHAIDDSLIEVALATAIVVIGAALVAYWLMMFHRDKQHREILYLGFFAMVFGIWNLGETQFVVFLFDNRAFWSYLAFTCLMILGLPAIHFFREFLEVNDKYFYKIITTYVIVETIIAQILHLTGIKGVKETANFTVASIVMVLFYLVFAIVSGIINRRSRKKILINLIGLSILVLTAVIDMTTYYTSMFTADKVAKVGFLLYAIILGWETTRIAREKMKEQQKLQFIQEMAVKDILTGCYNRNAYEDDIGQIDDLVGVQILGFDLNDLKKCNDTKGHMAGDQYIKDAAQVIDNAFGDLGKVYRVGGDEFCIVTKNVSEDTLMKKRIAFNQAIGKYLLEHPDSGFGIAFGWASYDEALDENVESIRHRADVFMYENKKEIKA